MTVHHFRTRWRWQVVISGVALLLLRCPENSFFALTRGLSRPVVSRSRVRCAAEEGSWFPNPFANFQGSMADPGYWKQSPWLVTAAACSSGGAMLTLLWLLYISVPATSQDVDSEGARISRPFALMDQQQALQLMEEGFLDVRHLPKAKDMANRIASSVNAAVVKIRQALLSSGYDEAECPLYPDTPETQKAGLAPKQAEAVTWGFAQIPGVSKLAVVGGCCGGKTKSKRHIREALKERLKIPAFATPEIATVLFLQGALSNGTYKDFVPEEYEEFMVQSEILQIVFEGIWSQGAALSVNGAMAILLTDRDAIDGKSYSRPRVRSEPISWSRILLKSGKLLKIPGLSDDDLVKRYIGAVFWHTAARGPNRTVDAETYLRYCQKPTRHESAKAAFDQDAVAAKVYADAYPSDAVLWLSSLHRGPLAPKLKKIVAFVEARLEVDPPSLATIRRPESAGLVAGPLVLAAMVTMVTMAIAWLRMQRRASPELREALVDSSLCYEDLTLQYFLAGNLKQFLPPSRDEITAMQLAPNDCKYLGYLAPDKMPEKETGARLMQYLVLGPVSGIQKYEFEKQCKVYSVAAGFREWQRDMLNLDPRKDVHVGLISAGTAARLGGRILSEGLAQLAAALTRDGRVLLVCNEEDEKVIGGNLEDVMEAQNWKEMEESGDLPPDPEKDAAVEVLQKSKLRLVRVQRDECGLAIGVCAGLYKPKMVKKPVVKATKAAGARRSRRSQNRGRAAGR
eukprot:symbB.v1.2.006528.t1/scaffold389.1/size214891/3